MEEEQTLSITFEDGTTKTYPIISFQQEGVFFQRSGNNFGVAIYDEPSERWVILGLEGDYDVQINTSSRDVAGLVTGLDVDADRQILLRVAYPNLVNACQADRYMAQLCNEHFWRDKVAFDFGEEAADLKPRNETSRRQYLAIYSTMSDKLTSGRYTSDDLEASIQTAIKTVRPDAVMYYLTYYPKAKDILRREGINRVTNTEADTEEEVKMVRVLKEAYGDSELAEEFFSESERYDLARALYDEGLLDDAFLAQVLKTLSLSVRLAAKGRRRDPTVSAKNRALWEKQLNSLSYLLEKIEVDDREVDPRLLQRAQDRVLEIQRLLEEER